MWISAWLQSLPLREVLTTLRLERLVVATPAGRSRAISLEVGAGEYLAANADPELATALARVVAGLTAPSSGTILVDGEDVTGYPPARRRIGYVPAGGALLPHLTVRENIQYGLRRSPVVRPVAARWVSSVVEQLELAAILDLRPHQLTDAQRLRVAIARAAAPLPEAMVIDLPQPTGGAARIRQLIPRVDPDADSPVTPGTAVLVCTASDSILDVLPRQVNVERRP